MTGFILPAHMRECKELLGMLQKIFKIFLTPPARDRPAAGPPRGPHAALHNAGRGRRRAGGRSRAASCRPTAERPRAGRRAAGRGPFHSLSAGGQWFFACPRALRPSCCRRSVELLPAASSWPLGRFGHGRAVDPNDPNHAERKPAKRARGPRFLATSMRRSSARPLGQLGH